jgi:hypothetical protein
MALLALMATETTKMPLRVTLVTLIFFVTASVGQTIWCIGANRTTCLGTSSCFWYNSSCGSACSSYTNTSTCPDYCVGGGANLYCVPKCSLFNATTCPKGDCVVTNGECRYSCALLSNKVSSTFCGNLSYCYAGNGGGCIQNC